MLTLNFKIVPRTLVSDGGINHLLLSMLILNLKILPKTLISDEVVLVDSQNLPADLVTVTKSVSQKICLGESAGRNTQICQQIHQICQSGDLPGGICWQKYPNLPVRRSAWGNLLAEIPKSASRFTKSASRFITSASQEICWEDLPAEIPKSASQEICWGGAICRQKYPGISASFEQILSCKASRRMITEVFNTQDQ